MSSSFFFVNIYLRWQREILYHWCSFKAYGYELVVFCFCFFRCHYISYLQWPPRHDRDFNFQRIFWPPCAIEFHNKQKYPESTKTLLTFDSSSTRCVRSYSHYQTKTFSFCHVDNAMIRKPWIFYNSHMTWPAKTFFLWQKKHRKNCEFCPVSLFIVRSLRCFEVFHWIGIEGCFLYVFTLKNPPLEGVL